MCIHVVIFRNTVYILNAALELQSCLSLLRIEHGGLGVEHETLNINKTSIKTAIYMHF